MPSTRAGRPRPYLIAHRGLPALGPENTLRGFRLALASEADALELDVRATADGHLVVLHDPTVDRTTDGSGPVAGMLLADLRRLDAGGEAVPTLEEALEVVAERDRDLILDVKTGGFEVALLAALRRYGLEDRCSISSFVPAVVVRCASLGTRARLAVSWPEDRLHVAGNRATRPLVRPGVRLLRLFAARAVERRLRHSGATIASLFHPVITPALVNRLGSAGFSVLAWTVNDVARARALVSWGVEAIVSDDVGVIAALASDRGA
ncbi:MAG: glycerophosphodiester phosphodiesterase [Candidatus Dormibacteria bacterium]